MKRPYYKVRYSALKDITAKAVAIRCFDGSEAILPKSQVLECLVENALYVPCWLAERKQIQYGQRKHWLETA